MQKTKATKIKSDSNQAEFTTRFTEIKPKGAHKQAKSCLL